jgi:hypothetical protein
MVAKSLSTGKKLWFVFLLVALFDGHLSWFSWSRVRTSPPKFLHNFLRRYALVAADASASRSILVFKHDLDKVCLFCLTSSLRLPRSFNLIVTNYLLDLGCMLTA